ncbi:MAG: clan AA aspartic protease [Candidatus Omnitrophica bacterium]|nr:clan AA aspartic protease [Candidatus Omnitrophota bacterium]
MITTELSVQGPVGKPVFLTMALDTGASMTSIPSHAAISIGCDPTKAKKKTEIITASGTEYVAIITIPRLYLWDTLLKNVKVICLDMPPQSPVSGLLGLNVLKKFDIFLRFSCKRLQIS